jgi:hypothetical protein
MPKPHWNAHSDLLALARSSVSYGNPSVLRANAGISAETGRLTTQRGQTVTAAWAIRFWRSSISLRETTSVSGPHLSDDVCALARDLIG